MANTSMTKLRKQLDASKKKLAANKEEGTKAVRAGMRTATSMGSAFGVSYFENRYPERKDIFGVPVSLFLGIGAVAAGALGVSGDDTTNDLIQSFGDGSLAAFAATKGKEMGDKARLEG